MTRRFAFAPMIAALALAACAPAQDARAPTDPRLDTLFAELSQARDAEAAQAIESEIRTLWSDSGSPTVNVLIERAQAAEDANEPDLANRFLDQAIDLAPEFAEPWNGRARLAYGAEDYPGAISAIQEVLKREPRHFGALLGLALIYEELGQERPALEAYRAALAIHPYFEEAREGVRRLEPRVDGREA